MNVAHSTARPTHEYKPTIIEERLLIKRLTTQVVFFSEELKRNWNTCNSDPLAYGKWFVVDLLRRARLLLATPNAVPAALTAVAAITCILVIALLLDRRPAGTTAGEGKSAETELTMIDISQSTEASKSASIGKDGPGRVGFQNKKGEGSGPSPKLAQGGGGGGNRNPAPPQTGKLPPPSSIQAAIPTAPPLHPPALPVAGIDIDPALWKDIKAPVFGDPKSKSEIESKGPGDGDGIGTNRGLGIGPGVGPGYGPGRDGNMGDGPKQLGCCGPGGGSEDRVQQPFSGSQVEQRARLLLKPEPQYTEEARRNQITGTVMLRVVFASSGEVVQIRAVRSLPFGLTERAIAAARQIKFVPAMKGGQPVSVFMQLEYNFNLY